jgi:L-arabinose isomerase
MASRAENGGRVAWSGREVNRHRETERARPDGDARATIGLVSVYFGLFDEQMRPEFRRECEALASAYAECLGERWKVVHPGLIASEADGDRANEVFRAERPAALVFAPTMAAPPSYGARAIHELAAPIIIWNAPKVATIDRDLTQARATENSTQVASVMFANTLIRLQRKFVAITARREQAEDMERLFRLVGAALAAESIRGATVLRIGSPIGGYMDVESTPEELAQLGVTERSVAVEELNRAFDAIDGAAARELIEELRRNGWEWTGGQTDETSARLALALRTLVSESNAIALTVNCHSNFLRWNTRIGISACLGASLLAAGGVPTSCTGDLPTALALRLAQALSGRALYCEFYAPESTTGLMLVAAGGEGDPSWADRDHPIRVEPNHHYPGHNGAGASVSFRLEPGAATALSLSPTADRWRLAWATGEITEARYDGLGGPNGMFRFDSGPATEAGAAWIASGATHHNALAKGRLDLEIPVLADTLGIDHVRI